MPNVGDKDQQGRVYTEVKRPGMGVTYKWVDPVKQEEQAERSAAYYAAGGLDGRGDEAVANLQKEKLEADLSEISSKRRIKSEFS